MVGKLIGVIVVGYLLVSILLTSFSSWIMPDCHGDNVNKQFCSCFKKKLFFSGYTVGFCSSLVDSKEGEAIYKPAIHEAIYTCMKYK